MRQIIDKELDGVVGLLNHNLALTSKDSKIDENNTDFRSRLSKILRDLKIESGGISQGGQYEKSGITYMPYTLDIHCTFEDFANLINALEKNERIIIVDEFKFSSNVKNISKKKKDPESIMRHKVQLDISTATLNSKKAN